ncbi:C-5 sterol desaturase, putative [Trypanosoma brucei gambiense DAL972]|uniref:C-5 sterol desaturase, putative n=1 Tax=Trypanosoma brucei gambiense (strain MHOM/CI/86/DAL972) TaxID=679716 RepID=C9ZN68_TRYB9|nr:C-5 sterol desaturase, putative [Trypanosoma brucei gambiense DAL972]CBH10722.1 C-5 sterol desaturase, putative [Trypanosoma brucei gambiense DAL972]|eukprot:XP_011773010.1 C-5 sterol desaturase, putative [Trypanosoma brucei gambiense DAL972]
MTTVVMSVALTATVFLGFSLYNRMVVPLIARVVGGRIPTRAQCLKTLTFKDRLFIALSKIFTVLFVYHSYLFITDTEVSNMSLNFNDFNVVLCGVAWMPVHLVALFIIYDFFYTLFHWALHWRPIYPLIHKHHHRQVTPFRGNDDAVNDHPIEYVIGEYNHIFALYLLTRIAPAGQVHVLTAILFVFIGGTLASLNHTRIDVYIPYVFNVRAHDLHHYQFKYNYGQYIMLWDWVFGTYKCSRVHGS